MKVLFILLLLVMGQTACRASFTNSDDESGISAASPESADVIDGGGEGDDLPIGGEDPNQGPPGSGGPGDDDYLEGEEIRIEEEFGPGEDSICPDGGKKVTIGIDKNLNGEIDEVISIEYHCNDGSKDECKPYPGNGGGNGGENGGDKGGKDDPGQSEDDPGQNGYYQWCPDY